MDPNGHRTPHVPDWTIVHAVTALAVALAAAMDGPSVRSMDGPSMRSVIQGILCGAFAIYGHQVAKQTKDRESGQKRRGRV